MNAQDFSPLSATGPAAPVNVTRLRAADIQFFDVKELNDRTAAQRARLRALLRDCREARIGHDNPVYAAHETLFRQRQISELWQDYRQSMAESTAMTAAYLAQCARRTYRFATVSPSSLPTRKTSRAAA
jgi:hypothetical protein